MWTSVYEGSTVDDKYDTFIQILTNHFNSSFPVKQVKQLLNKKCKWMTTKITVAKDTLNFMFELYTHNHIPKQAYNNYKTYYSNLVLQEKRNYYDRQICDSHNKSKTIWNIIKTEKGLSKSTQEYFTGIKSNNETISSMSVASNIFNEYFVTVAASLVDSSVKNRNLNHINNNVLSMYLSEVDDVEILEIINGLKNKCSSGEDGISNILLKK